MCQALLELMEPEINEIKRKAYETFWLLKHLTTISYRWKTF